MTPVSLTIVQANGNCLATAVDNAVALREHIDARPWVVLYMEDASQAKRLALMMQGAV